MSEFDLKFAAYEGMMKRNNNFGMSGDILAKYYGDYSVRLQEAISRKEKKAFNKEYGRMEAKKIAQQRSAFRQQKVQESAKFNSVYNEKVLPSIEKEFGQPKNPLLKGITYGQSKPQRLIPEIQPKSFEEILSEDVRSQFKPQNPLLESVKPGRDFRGKNLIGKQYTEAQKILHDAVKPGTNVVKSTSRFSKFGKFGAIIAGVTALGVGIWVLCKGCDNDKLSQAGNPLIEKPAVKPPSKKTAEAPKQNETPKNIPADTTKTDKITQKETDKAVIKPIAEVNDSAEVKGIETDKEKEVEKNSKAKDAKKAEETVSEKEPKYVPLLELDEDGSYITKRGDSFWRLAHKHLKDKFKAQNIDRKPTNAEIQRETERIMKANNYGYDKDHWFSDPMLHPNVKLIIE